MSKIKAGVTYGGQSFEHEVSKMTAKSILEHIDRELFIVTEIYIDKNGEFDEALLDNIDVAFLAVHGPNCEDGVLQQLLEDRNIKYTGPGVKASQTNMNKTLMHNAYAKNGLPVVQYKGFDLNCVDNIKTYISTIGLPVIIKPDNAGSSVGISLITKMDELDQALELANECDKSIIIEKAVSNPREIEVGILGNTDLIVSEPGEILTCGEVYSYETKYNNPFSTTLTPDLTDEQIETFKDLAKKAYTSTGCKGYSRVDFLMENDKIFINEINTLPGFTSISMFPKLMANIGINYKELITKIINLALE